MGLGVPLKEIIGSVVFPSNHKMDAHSSPTSQQPKSFFPSDLVTDLGGITSERHEKGPLLGDALVFFLRSVRQEGNELD